MQDPREHKVLVKVAARPPRKLIHQHQIIEIADLSVYPFLGVALLLEVFLEILNNLDFRKLLRKILFAHTDKFIRPFLSV